MNNINLDFFKVFLIVILVGFLFVFSQYAKNGRYQSRLSAKVVLDTRTGTVYKIHEGKLIIWGREVDPKNWTGT